MAKKDNRVPSTRHHHLDALRATARKLMDQANKGGSFDEIAKEAGQESVPADITLRSRDRDLFAGSVDIVEGTIVDKALRHAFEQPGRIPTEVVL